MAQKTVRTRKTTYRAEVQGNVARQLYAVPDRQGRQNRRAAPSLPGPGPGEPGAGSRLPRGTPSPHPLRRQRRQNRRASPSLPGPGPGDGGTHGRGT